MAFRFIRLFRAFSVFPIQRTPILPPFQFREFAKKKGGKADDKKEKSRDRRRQEEAESADDVEFDMDQIREDMSKPLKFFEESLQKIKIGRGDPRIFDELYVASKKDHLINLAQVMMKNSNELTIKPFDEDDVDQIITAINLANINVTCRKDTHGSITITIPKPTKELRNELVKQARVALEETKSSIRNHRTSAIQTIKKIEEIGEDELKSLQKQVQKIHDEMIKKAEEMMTQKEKAINSS